MRYFVENFKEDLVKTRDFLVELLSHLVQDFSEQLSG